VSIGALVKSTINGIVPVELGSWTGATKPSQYAIFTTVSAPNAHADNLRKGWRHHIYLTLFSTVAYATQKASIIAAVEGAGFSVVDIDEGFDNGDFRCAFTLLYLEAV
jgi:hypothetical protein